MRRVLRDDTRPLNGRTNRTAYARKRSRGRRPQARAIIHPKNITRAQRRARLAHMIPRKKRHLWSGWRPNWGEIINFISFLLLMIFLLGLWLLLRQLYEGEP